MGDLPTLMRRHTRFTLFFLSAGFIMLAFRPEWKPYIGGFLMGIAGGFLVSLHLAWRISSVAAKAAAGRLYRRRGAFGYASRMALGALAAIISVRALDFDLPATTIGLLTGPMATLVLGLASIRRLNRGQPDDERGEKQ